MTDAEIERLKAEVIRLRDAEASLTRQLADAEENLDKWSAKYGDIDDFDTLCDRIHDIRALSVRPVGKLTPSIPDCPASQRALLALFDAAGVAP